MNGCLRVVRGNEVKLALPGPSITTKADGTLWMSGNPILGIDDPAEKAKIAALVRAGKYDQIPAIYYTRLGDNPNGLWAGTDEEWAKHPAKAEQDRSAAIKATEAAKQVGIYLSSRGWGDYSACEWVGDLTRPDTEILAECRTLLATGHDVDQPNQSDEEIMDRITAARDRWAAKDERAAAYCKAEAEDTQHKIANGFCFACLSYCYGDCGHYTTDPMAQYLRDFQRARRGRIPGNLTP